MVRTERSRDQVEDFFTKFCSPPHNTTVQHAVPQSSHRNNSITAVIMSTYTLRSQELEAAIESFYKAYVNMLAVGPGQYIERDKMRVTCEAGVSLTSPSNSSG